MTNLCNNPGSIPNVEPGAWTFDSADVAKKFDNHVREQLPWYEMATQAVVHVGRHYIPEDGLVYDIGASTGNMGKALEQIITSRHAKIFAIERSKEMANLYTGPGELIVEDAIEFQYQPFDFAIIFLAAIFMPVSKRKILFDKLRDNLLPGGAIVMVERMVATSGYPSTIASRLTLINKLNAGVSPKEIIDKELSLGGIQRPISPSELPKQAVEFFRMGDFAGWIIEK